MIGTPKERIGFALADELDEGPGISTSTTSSNLGKFTRNTLVTS